VDPAAAFEHAEVVATGRSDFPNQINNGLPFPSVFRGLLDAQSAEITSAMLLAAARALASIVTDGELNAPTSPQACSTPTCTRPWPQPSDERPVARTTALRSATTTSVSERLAGTLP
jgi:malic enzyme